MKKLFLLALAMATTFVYAQDQDASPNDNSETFIDAKSTYLTFDMATPLFPVNPRYSFGVIQSVSPKWKLGVDFGVGADEISFNWTERDDQEDWSVYEIRLDVYRVFNPTRIVQHYMGAEVFFNYHENALTNEEYRLDRDDNFEIRYDSADLERVKYGFNLKYGVFIPFAPNAGMNIYVGAGIRIRDNKHTNVVNAFTDTDLDDDTWFERYHYYEGVTVRPNVTGGFKLYYKFN